MERIGLNFHYNVDGNINIKDAAFPQLCEFSVIPIGIFLTRAQMMLQFLCKKNSAGTLV